MRVVALFDDVLLGSTGLGRLRAGGPAVTVGAAAAAVAPDGADVLVVDLGTDGFDGVAVAERLRAAGELGGTRLLGVYSHVHHDVKLRAEGAGFDLVVPRSRMAREGAALVDRLAASGG